MKKLSEHSPVNLAMHDFERIAAEDERRYLMQRRDATNDKIRFGLIGLNGASLLALLSALGGNAKAAEWIGFSASNAVASAFSFAIGLALAGYAVTAEQNLAIEEAGAASARAQTLRRLVALYDQEATGPNHDRIGSAMADLESLPLTGFRFSKRIIAAQNFSAGAWAFGLYLPLVSKLDFGGFWSGLLSLFGQ